MNDHSDDTSTAVSGREVMADRKGPIRWMAANPIAANLLMVILLVGGLWTAFRIQKEVFPQFQLDIVTVTADYPGASPAEVEQGVLLPVEEAVKGVQGIKEMVSTASEGAGLVELELVAGTDRMKAFQDIDQAVNRIRTFPEDMEEPQVELLSNLQEVMQIVLYGPVDIWTLRTLSERLRDQLLNHPAITQVQIEDVPAYVTHIEIPQYRLREHGLTLEAVARLIEDSSRDIPAGSVETGSGEILLRVNERKQWASEFGRIEILADPSGAKVTLADLARVTDGFEEEGFHSQFNGQPSVEINVYRVGDQSPLDIAAAVTSVLKLSESTLPAGVAYRMDNDQASDYRERLSLLIENGLIAAAIVLVILAVFLGYQLAFWVMMGMTISFIGGMVFLPMMGISINMISMFAFLVVLGIVVDDAIVVGENVHEKRLQGVDPMSASVAGAREMTAPVTFSILTTIVAFIPLMFIPGTTGKFWWPLPVVVATVLAVSLVEALFILPAHLSHFGRRRTRGVGRHLDRWQKAMAEGLNRFVDRHYRKFLDWCLRNRYVTLSAALALLVMVGGYGYSDHMGMIMMPDVAADEIEAGVTLPVGTTRAQAAKVAEDITASTQRMFEEHQLEHSAEGIKTNVRGQNFIDVEIVMKPPGQSKLSVAEVIHLWRNEIGDIAGVDQITFEAESGPGGWLDDISVDLSHADIEVLEKASRVFFDQVKRFEATRDVNDNYNRGKAQLDFIMRPEARHLGLTSAEVGRQVRAAFFGAVALRQPRGTNEIEVRVKLPDHERQALNYIEDFVVFTPDGTQVPLTDVVEIRQGEAFSTIHRRDGRRVVTVGMDVEPKRATSQVLAAIRKDLLPALHTEFPGITWTYKGSSAEMRESTQTLWGGFALAMAVVYSLLAVAFGSYIQPLIVMAAIPFGIVGAVIGHILLGFDLSLISLMGVIALSGVVVNDSLIMTIYANRRRRYHNDGAFEAIHRAGLRRFRPIILTTLTTFGGLTPIILETSRQAAYLIPMAISLGFGIIFATSIILVIVPCLYMVLEDIRGWVKR